MSETEDRVALVRRWVEKAEEDLVLAEHGLTMTERCPYDLICYHAQQCAEKYLKALLAWQTLRVPRTHDLRFLVRQMPADLKLDTELDHVITLNRYSIETRYPESWDDIERPEAERAIALARAVRDAVRPTLPAAAL
jgi:HEPN domain-containing protein